MTKTARILDGSKIAATALSALSQQIETLRKAGRVLTLATVQVGNSRDADLYAKSLERLMQKLGIDTVSSRSPEKISDAELSAKIRALNDDPTVTGILVFSPLPPHLNTTGLMNTIDVLKDVEGRRVLNGNGERVVSPTAGAVMKLLDDTGEELAGKSAVVIGHSDIVGKPTAILLMDRYATVTVCHIKTNDLRSHVESADIVVAAAGKAHLVKGDWIKPGAIVIDVGENVVNGKLVGDVEFDEAKRRASHISPVPGGVGPVTNVMLVKNLITLHNLKQAANGHNGSH